jgi:hypothetical protein
MRMLIALAIAVVIVAVAFGLKTAFIPGSVDHTGSAAKAMAASKTLSPHEIHLNYQKMKDLPVVEVKEPF